MNRGIVTVIQARTGSSRLPGKITLPLGDETILIQMLRRVARAKHAGTIVVATTTHPDDEAVAALCINHGYEVFRGHETDLLDRHYQVLQQYGGDAVVKIPSDCPLIDPEAIDEVLGFFLHRYGEFDYVSNLHPQSWPDGNDVEVMTAPALATAWHEAKKDFEREHTTSFLWDNPRRFRIGNVRWAFGDFSKTHRYTLDYPEDYRLIREIFDRLYPVNAAFGARDILDLLYREPALREINQKHLGYVWYAKHQDELQTLGSEA